MLLLHFCCSNLFNKAELALQLVGCPPQLNEAQLLLHLYAAKGLDMLGMLQGQYAFCLYDSKQVGGRPCWFDVNMAAFCDYLAGTPHLHALVASSFRDLLSVKCPRC